MSESERKALNDSLKQKTKELSEIKKAIKSLPKPPKAERKKESVHWIGKRANTATARANKGTPEEVGKRKTEITSSWRKMLEKMPKNVSDDDMLKTALKAVDFLVTQAEPKKAAKQTVANPPQ